MLVLSFWIDDNHLCLRVLEQGATWYHCYRTVYGTYLPERGCGVGSDIWPAIYPTSIFLRGSGSSRANTESTNGGPYSTHEQTIIAHRQYLSALVAVSRHLNEVLVLSPIRDLHTEDR